MISNRPMIPMLTHVDNLGDINLDMTSQEQSLQQIKSDTESIKQNTSMIRNYDGYIYQNTEKLDDKLLQINQNSSQTSASVGTPTDADTATTVIGLLKSIVNKLS